MSKEYKSLDEFFPSGRGDGRKFASISWGSDRWFEPIFRDNSRYWNGLGPSGNGISFLPAGEWREWHPPKTKKKVTLYRAVFKMLNGEYVTDTSWSSTKTYTCTLIHLDSQPPIFYEEREIEFYE